MITILKHVIQQFKDDCLESGIEMLLEADVCGWLFHLLAERYDIRSDQIHLDTRVCNAKGRFDIVIGPTGLGSDGRPCIQPKFVVEIKIFPRFGFTDQQHRVHYEHILNDDLRKLGELDPALGIIASLIVDGRGYLNGNYGNRNRKEILIERRSQVAAGAHVFIVHFIDGHWQIDHEPPEKRI